MTDEQFEDFLTTTLKRDAKPADADAVDRVLARLRGPLPRQKQPLWRFPGVLLNWDFAPAWPPMAALACCAAGEGCHARPSRREIPVQQHAREPPQRLLLSRQRTAQPREDAINGVGIGRF